MNVYRNVGTTTGDSAFRKTYRGRSRDDGKVRVRVNRRAFQNRLAVPDEEEIVVPRQHVDKKGRPLPTVPTTFLTEDEPVYDLPDELEEIVTHKIRKNIRKSSKGIQTEPLVDAVQYDDVVYPYYRKGNAEAQTSVTDTSPAVLVTDQNNGHVEPTSDKPPIPPRKRFTLPASVSSDTNITVYIAGKTNLISPSFGGYIYSDDRRCVVKDDTISSGEKVQMSSMSYANDNCSQPSTQEEANAVTMRYGYDQLMTNNDDANIMQDEEVEYLFKKKMALELRSRKDLVKIMIQKDNIELLKMCRANRKTWIELQKEERMLNTDIENMTENRGEGESQKEIKTDEESEQTAVKQIGQDNLNIGEYYYWTPKPGNIFENRFTRQDEMIGSREPSRNNSPIYSEKDDDFFDLK